MAELRNILLFAKGMKSEAINSIVKLISWKPNKKPPVLRLEWDRNNGTTQNLKFRWHQFVGSVSDAVDSAAPDGKWRVVQLTYDGRRRRADRKTRKILLRHVNSAANLWTNGRPLIQAETIETFALRFPSFANSEMTKNGQLVSQDNIFGDGNPFQIAATVYNPTQSEWESDLTPLE